jgi:putative translation initiation factor aIF-2 beta subunit
MEEYERLLDSAFKQVKTGSEECERFEIKKPEVRFEGNKTIIANFAQIVTCLRRNEAHFVKFLFKELAAPGEVAGDRLILTRKVPINKVAEKIALYANKYVICPKCKKPDTEIIEDSGRYLKCLACGNKLKIVD